MKRLNDNQNDPDYADYYREFAEWILGQDVEHLEDNQISNQVANQPLPDAPETDE